MVSYTAAADMVSYTAAADDLTLTAAAVLLRAKVPVSGWCLVRGMAACRAAAADMRTRCWVQARVPSVTPAVTNTSTTPPTAEWGHYKV